jgi:hypothetical protein
VVIEVTPPQSTHKRTSARHRKPIVNARGKRVDGITTPVGGSNRRIDTPPRIDQNALGLLHGKQRARALTAIGILLSIRQAAIRLPRHKLVRDYAALHWVLQEIGVIEGAR